LTLTSAFFIFPFGGSRKLSTPPVTKSMAAVVMM